MKKTFADFDFILMAPEYLHQLVPVIHPGLLDIQRQARKKGFDWEFLNILKEVEINLASLTMVYKDENYAGFLISKSVIIGLPNKHYYQLVAQYVEPQHRSYDGPAWQASIDYVEELAHDLQCQGVLHKYFRPGHTPRLEKRGYQVREITALKEF